MRVKMKHAGVAIDEEVQSKVGYVLGCYDPEDCTYEYFGFFGFQPELHGSTVFPSEKEALVEFDKKKNGFCPDRAHRKKGLRILTSKVFAKVAKSPMNTFRCPRDIQLTKYNHYQKLASIMT